MKQLHLFLITFFIASTGYCQLDYTWQNPLPAGVHWSSIKALDSNNLYFSATSAAMVKTNDGGQTFTNISLKNPNYRQRAYHIAMLDVNNGYGNVHDTLVMTTNGGQSWTHVPGLPWAHQRDFHAITMDTLVGLTDNYAYRSTDAGQNWSTFNLNIRGATSQWMNGMKGYAFGATVYRGDTGAVEMTVDGGQSWTRISDNSKMFDLFKGYAVNEDIIIMYGPKDAMAITTDGGTTWNRYSITLNTSSNIDEMEKMVFLDENTGYALNGTWRPILFKTTDGGKTWDDISPSFANPDRYLSDFVVFDQNTIWLAGSHGYIGKSTNAGSNWTEISRGTTINLGDISFIDDNNGVAVGDENIFYTNNGGDTWTEANVNSTSDLLAVQMVNANVAYAVGFGNTIHKSTDGGKNWTVSNQVDVGSSYDIWFVNENVGMIAGNVNHNFVRTTDGGQTWTSYTIGSGQARALSFTDSLTGWMTTDNQVFKTIDAGANWTMLWDTTGWNITDIMMVNANIGYIIGPKGYILKTTDGGNKWNMISYGEPDVEVKKLFFTDENNGWIGGQNQGYLFSTTNGGQTWQRHNFNTNNEWRNFYFRSKDLGWVVGNGGTIARIGSGGGTGNNTPTPPSNLTLTVKGKRNSGKIELNWQDNSNNELGFIIYRDKSNSGTWVTVDTVGMDVEMYLDENLDQATSYTYAVAAYNSNGVSAKSNSSSATTSIKETPALHNMKLYPNPIQHNTVLSIKTEQNEEVALQLLDIAGRVIHTEHHKLLPGDNNISLNKMPYKAGIYLLKVSTTTATGVIKVVID